MLNNAACGLLAGVVIACVGAAQVDTPQQRFVAARAELERHATAQLRSDDWATVAWGAHTVAEHRLTACIPEVRKRLAQAAGPHPVAHSLLDALIQTGAVVPGEELEPALSCGAPAIVLLSRSPDANRALLLRAFGPTGAWMSGERRACGNLLAGLRDAGFVRELLRGPIKPWIQVTDPGAKTEPMLEWMAAASAAAGSPCRTVTRRSRGTGCSPVRNRGRHWWHQDPSRCSCIARGFTMVCTARAAAVPSSSTRRAPGGSNNCSAPNAAT